MASKVGIKDIASRCGVSKTAVSLVLNDRKGVSPATRDRILQAIDEMGFRPNHAARRLGRGARGGKSVPTQLGFIGFDRWADTGHSYYGPILAGASLHAQEIGCGLSYYQVINPTDDIPDNVDVSSFEGLLVTGQPTPGFLELMNQMSKHFVLVSPSTPHIDANCVRPENIESAWIATRHLVQLGHTRIGYLGGQDYNTDAQERYFGYRLAMQEAGLEVPDEYAVFKDFSPPGGAAGLRELHERGLGLTAVFAAGDYLAIGAYDAAYEMDLSIPGDVSIVGFDDIEPVRYLRPALTTIQMDLHTIGARALDRLLQIVAKPQNPIHLRVPGKLLERDSTSPPKK